MIALYANWTGRLLATGASVEEAWSNTGHFCPGSATKIGTGAYDVTALDCGPSGLPGYGDSATSWRHWHLCYARRLYPLAPAPFALARIDPPIGTLVA